MSDQGAGLARGPKGDKGEPGRRLPAVVAWSIAYLFALTVLLVVGGYVLQQHEIRDDVAHQKAAQARQAQVFEMKLCTTLDRLAALRPPPGPPAHNPSRAYLQDEHATLAQLAPDVDCNQEGTPS